MNELVVMLVARHELREQFNVIKFRTDELKLSFLSYPGFMEDAHPALPGFFEMKLHEENYTTPAAAQCLK